MAAHRAVSDLRALPLFMVPSPVHYEFCRVMDVLSDQDWTRFASEVLRDITAVRLAGRNGHRTDSLMQQWQNRNGSVGELLDLLRRLELLRPWDIINNWASSLPPQAAAPQAAAPLRVTPPKGSCPPCEPEPAEPHPLLLTYCPSQSEIAKLLPKPLPPARSPNQSELSTLSSLPKPLSDSLSLGMYSLGVMAWDFEEVSMGTCGFCSSLKVGEGGFGEVYRASLRNVDCAVKRFKKDSSLDWSLLRDSFQTEVEKLSKFRHPNIVELLGFCDGGTYCLIYSFMENRSLDDQLRSNALPWSRRVSIAKGAASALQYLHCPPRGQAPLVHGDVKSSNILLDRHFEAKLADFGLARFMPHGSSGRTGVQTSSFGQTEEVRGTLAYLPEDYIRRSCKLNASVDAYGFGVVLLEMITGRRALEKDETGRDVFLKDLVNDIGESEVVWREHVDKRLWTCDASEPTGFMQTVSLARTCLNKWKKRPSMTKVYEILQRCHVCLDPPSPLSTSLPSVLHSSGSSLSHRGPPRSLDSSLSALSITDPSGHALGLSPPQTLQCSVVPPAPRPAAAASPQWCSSFDGPCETDESRGYSQYDVKSADLIPERSDCELRCGNQASVPTEDQYDFSPNSENKLPNGNRASGNRDCASPAEPLLSQSPVLEKMTRCDQGLSPTPELLSTEERYLVQSPVGSRLPEESDELEYLQSKTQ